MSSLQVQVTVSETSLDHFSSWLNILLLPGTRIQYSISLVLDHTAVCYYFVSVLVSPPANRCQAVLVLLTSCHFSKQYHLYQPLFKESSRLNGSVFDIYKMYVINEFLFDDHTLNPLDLEEVTIVKLKLIAPKTRDFNKFYPLNHSFFERLRICQHFIKKQCFSSYAHY